MNNISVIIPTFQSPDALNLCLRSCIEGQLQQNEIIVVVDGYYDLNKDVLNKWKDNIKILNLEQNQGLCRATNLGVYNATSDRILIVNDDNVFPKNWDEKLDEFPIKGRVWSPNQIEPIPSMFKQFVIKDLGKDPKTFNLKEFWEFEKKISLTNCTYKEYEGSTLPIYMNRLDYLRIGGWDENYEQGMVADWDFFLKCQLSNLEMNRNMICHFYHFVSLSINNEKRAIAERNAHEYAKYKWGTYIKHNPETNLKYL